MYDWTDDFLESAKMSYPSLLMQVEGLTINGDIELAMELLLDQRCAYV